MQVFTSLEEAKFFVMEAHRAEGHPSDDAGTRKLLIALRALNLIDWVEKDKPTAG